MAETATAHHHPKRGWYLSWSNGFESAMPNEEAAKQCATAPDLFKALDELLGTIREWDIGLEGFHSVEQADAAIAAAPPNS